MGIFRDEDHPEGVPVQPGQGMEGAFLARPGVVADDGIGFDMSAPADGKKHIGIRNVRERLQAMCGGSLTIESQPGAGTRAVIRIPKEGKTI